MAPAQGEAEPTLTEYKLPTDKAKYIINKSEMERFLKKTFGGCIVFHVSVSLERPKIFTHADEKRSMDLSRGEAIER